MPFEPVNEQPDDERPGPSGPQSPGGEGPPALSGGDMARYGLWFYGAMAIAAVVWRVGFHREPIFFLDEAAYAAGIDWPMDLGIGVAVGLSVVALSEWATRATGWGERLARALAEPLAGLDVPNAVLLALASGLAEEMLFRGALQPRVGLIWASLIFGLIHIGPSRDLAPWTVFAVVVGFLFGALFEWRGNLVAPIVAHTVINAVNLPRLILEYGGGGPSARAGPDDGPSGAE